MAEILNINENSTDKEALKEMLNSLFNEYDASGFAVLMSMEDEQFNTLAPLFLEEIQKEVNKPESLIQISSELNALGIKLEDITKDYNAIYEALSKNGQLSETKLDFFKKLIGYIQNAVSQSETINKKVITIPTSFCNDFAKMPAYAHLGDAGADIYATEDITLAPGQRTIVKTGLKMEIPNGYAILIQPRSGLSSKTGLRISNSPGLIDSNYRGELGVIIENIESPIKNIVYNTSAATNSLIVRSIERGTTYTISRGDKIAQMRLVEVPIMNFVAVGKVDENTNRGEGGFGSTDKK